MTWLTILITWFTISIVALGLFSLFTYFARKDESSNWRDERFNELMQMREEGTITEDQLRAFESLSKLGSKIPIDPQLLGLGICIECSANIPPDEQPYCTDCFERLEQDGFFD